MCSLPSGFGESSRLRSTVIRKPGDDAGRGDADAHARLGVDLADETDLGNVDAVGVEVVEEDAVEQVHT